MQSHADEIERWQPVLLCLGELGCAAAVTHSVCNMLGMLRIIGVTRPFAVEFIRAFRVGCMVLCTACPNTSPKLACSLTPYLLLLPG
jgi:hypothetical protein